MASIQLIDKLLEIPLFQGMSKEDLYQIIGTAKFEFEKHEPGRIIAKADSKCTKIRFMLSGEVEAVTYANDHSFCVTEYISAPLQLQQERLFGYRQQYTTTFRAHTLCHFMNLGKGEITKMYNQYEVFRINLINQLATMLQKQQDSQWRPNRGTLRDKLVRFLITHTLHPAGEKHYKVRMQDLANEFSTSRNAVSEVLNDMQREGIVTLTRGQIHIDALEKLLR